MSLGLVFWILMLFWFVLGLLPLWALPGFPVWPGHLLLFLLFLIVGWKVFEAPIHG